MCGGKPTEGCALQCCARPLCVDATGSTGHKGRTKLVHLRFEDFLETLVRFAYMKALRIMAVKPAKSLEEDSNPLGTPLVGTTA